MRSSRSRDALMELLQRVQHAVAAACASPPKHLDEAICDGGVLVAVHCEERLVRDARDILDTHAPDGIDESAQPFGEGAATPVLPPALVNGKNRH